MIQESLERMNELIDILNDANYNYYVKDNPTITELIDYEQPACDLRKH